MEKSPSIVVESKKGEEVKFDNFADFLKFYYKNIVTDDSVSWTDFVYNNYSNGNSKRDINGYTITGANEALQAEIFNHYKKQGLKVLRKSNGFNIGCEIEGDINQYIKTPSTGVTGKYNWLNEIFIYKLLEKLGYGPKVNFDILKSCPLALIRTEDIKKEADRYIAFSEGEHKSIRKDQLKTKEELANIGVAEVLVGKILLLDDLHYKEGTNYSFIRNADDKLELKIFDCMSQHFGNDLKPLNKDFSFSQERQVFYTKRHPYYAVSGSFLAEDVRNLGIDLGINKIEKNKEKFQNAIQESMDETYKLLDQIKKQFPEKEDQKSISELYNEKAFHEFLRTISNNLQNIENFHSSSVTIKPSAALIPSNYQDEGIYGKQMSIVYNGKNDQGKVKEQSAKFQDYLTSLRSSDSLIKK